MFELMREVLHWFTEMTAKLGYTGIFIGMTIESTFIPLPSEVILPPAGYLAAQGRMEIVPIVAAGTLGSIAGALINYAIGVYLGRRFILKYGPYVGLSAERYHKTESFFLEHGEISTFIGRLILGMRHFISFPAGVTRMHMGHFIGFTAAGAAIWSTILTLLGYYVGGNEALLKQYYRETGIALIGFCALLALAYVWWWRRRTQRGVCGG